ncbi:site-2 protease family protein [Granulicella sp. WH15]|uniref:site-2 protease family protein n=1 Tax=Granulicella sp. WH15 TaxID=2602070 RepID=UPI00136749FA|nr:site-2 protease family protein [Granulicella sp. WH15]QHN04871.1 site-2 protease family protein [Granulicella sp. WH15]
MSLEVALAVFEFVVLLLAISLHDSVQAWMAARLGDPTAKMMGRISLNPLRHYDLLGTVIFPIVFLFQSPLVLAWGKPVPMTPRNFRRGSKDEMLVFLSGPLAHLGAAGVFLVLLLVLKHVVPMVAMSLPAAAALSLRSPEVSTEFLPPIFPIVLFFYYGILVNLLLFAFNLVPLPSLDGGRVLRHFLPYNAMQQYDRWGFYLTILFFFFGFRVILLIMTPLLNIFNGLLSVL